MLTRLHETKSWAILCATTVAALAVASDAGAHGAGGHGNQGKPAAQQKSGASHDEHRAGGDRTPIYVRPPHGGRMTTTAMQYFEVVYLTKEIRIYIYGRAQRPESVKNVRGEVVMHVRGNPQPFRYRIEKTGSTTGGDKQEFLSLPVDMSRIRDGEMQVTFVLGNLAYEQEPQVTFTQPFAISRVPATVTVAQITAEDKAAIERQAVCPVMDSPLDDHGDPIKLMVGERPLFVCCEGCIEQVRKNPDLYLQKAAAGQANRQPPRPQVGVYWATQADDPAVRAQRICPVMNGPLGGHGRPIKVVIDGQPVFVCCQGCVDKVVRNPAMYFAAIKRNPNLTLLPAVREQQPDRYVQQNRQYAPKPEPTASDGSCCSSKKGGPGCH